MPVEFDPEMHIYRIDGHAVPSVSDILAHVTADYYAGVDPQLMREAAERGTATHLAVQLLNEGTLDESTVDPAVKPYLDAYRVFRAQTGFIPDYAEIRLGHERMRFAGTPDMIGMIGYGRRQKPVRAVIDIKTTVQLLPTVGLQLAGYQILWNFNQIDPRRFVTQRYALQLKANGQYDFEPFDDASDATVFIGLTNEYHWRKAHGL